MAENDKDQPSPAAHFLRRRDQWMRWVIESDMELRARVVGVHLAIRMSVQTQVAWPNVETMAKSLSLSARHIRRAIRELEEFGAIYVARRPGKGNYYYLRFPYD